MTARREQISRWTLPYGLSLPFWALFCRALKVTQGAGYLSIAFQARFWNYGSRDMENNVMNQEELDFGVKTMGDSQLENLAEEFNDLGDLGDFRFFRKTKL